MIHTASAYRHLAQIFFGVDHSFRILHQSPRIIWVQGREFFVIEHARQSTTRYRHSVKEKNRAFLIERMLDQCNSEHRLILLVIERAMDQYRTNEEDRRLRIISRAERMKTFS